MREHWLAYSRAGPNEARSGRALTALSGMAVEYCLDVPEADRAVSSARREHSAVLRKGNRKQRARRDAQHPNLPARCCVG
jgi:hypothetical protein